MRCRFFRSLPNERGACLRFDRFRRAKFQRRFLRPIDPFDLQRKVLSRKFSLSGEFYPIDLPADFFFFVFVVVVGREKFQLQFRRFDDVSQVELERRRGTIDQRAQIDFLVERSSVGVDQQNFQEEILQLRIEPLRRRADEQLATPFLLVIVIIIVVGRFLWLFPFRVDGRPFSSFSVPSVRRTRASEFDLVAVVASLRNRSRNRRLNETRAK